MRRAQDPARGLDPNQKSLGLQMLKTLATDLLKFQAKYHPYRSMQANPFW